MKVCLIYRDPSRGNFSIENIFAELTEEIGKKVEIILFHTSSNLIKDFYRIWKIKADVYHITGDVHYMAIPLLKRKVIITVHDVGYLDNPVLKSTSSLKTRLYKFIWFDLPMRLAGTITTVSEYTKSRLLEHCKIIPSKVVVIHNPLFKRFLQPFGLKSNEVKKVLHIGTAPHKNLDRLILATSGLPVELIIVGRLNGASLDLLKANKTHYSNYISIDNFLLLELYQECDVVFFASLHEGFGLPIIEGQACGKIIITSSRCSMPEVGENSVIYVNPVQVSEIRHAIEGAIYDEALTDNLKKLGFQNIKRFALPVIAEKYIDVYKKAVLN